MTYLTKGMRVTAQWFQAAPTCLAGMQPKVGAQQITIIGVVTHVRGDHPTNPTTIRLWVQPDDGSAEVIVNPDHVVSVS